MGIFGVFKKEIDKTESMNPHPDNDKIFKMNKFEIIKKYIDEYDYYGLLAGHAPNDEFDSYSQMFADTITEYDSAEDIARLIAETMDKAFAEKINPEKFIDTARNIRKALYGDG